MPKKKEPSTVEKETPKKEVKEPANAHATLARFLKEHNIILDYEIVTDRMFQTGDGLVLKPKHPLIKITARYG